MQVAGKADRDQVYLIDRAALEVGEKRAHFVVRAALERARRILERAA